MSLNGSLYKKVHMCVCFLLGLTYILLYMSIYVIINILKTKSMYVMLLCRYQYIDNKINVCNVTEMFYVFLMATRIMHI